MTAIQHELTLRVESVTREAEDVISLTLVNADGSALPSWEPGSHIGIIVPSGRSAQYSLCGPLTAAYWQIAVLLQKDGRGASRHIHESLKPGEIFAASGPRNNFALLPANRYLFIAGGIGITPMLPMIESVEQAGVPWQLIYGGRDLASMAFVEKLRDPNSRVVILPQDRFGLIPVTKLADSLPEGCRVYCCGPEPLLMAVQEVLSSRGLPQAHVERFQVAPGLTDKSRNRSFMVYLARSGQSIEIGAQESIVEGLAEHGVVITTSCEEGFCGTCKTRVLAGEIEHRDCFLTEDEKARQDTILPCVSRATRQSLTLDL
ncbi:ferredoxin-NADP reductase [Mesorhizobium shonense]|uniref:Ferredoxin-NADP reductase n=1 Tax=Mesorhizobium shonense TaxID=1209948 RepID=A0ABV2HWN3_9HYPH